MKISYRGDYALKIILDLSLCWPDKLAHIEEIAKRQDIPKKFLEQILLDLKKGGFVQSKKGPNGGYSLAKKPSEISIADILSYIEGSIYPIACVDPLGAKTCNETTTCLFRPIWLKTSKAISEIIESINFADLVKKQRQKQDILTYHI